MAPRQRDSNSSRTWSKKVWPKLKFEASEPSAHGIDIINRKPSFT